MAAWWVFSPVVLVRAGLPVVAEAVEVAVKGLSVAVRVPRAGVLWVYRYKFLSQGFAPWCGGSVRVGSLSPGWYLWWLVLAS